MSDTNNNVEQLQKDVELIRDVLAIFLDKAQAHSKTNLLMRLYGVDDLGRMIGRLNATYNELNLE